MNPQIKTLVVLTPAFPKNESETSWLPSQQLLIKNLKNQFPKLNILVVSFFYPYEKHEYNWNGVKVIAFGGMHKRKLRRLELWRNIWRELKKLKKEIQFVGILSFWCHECALVGKWFAYRYKIKHFCWVCGQDARKSNKYVKWIRPRSNELVAISDFIIDEFERNHKVRPAHLVPIAIDQTMFLPMPRKREIDIIAVGSFSYQKNYDQFVYMIASLKEKFPSIKAIHCGAGEDEENIKKLIKQLDLEHNLVLSGIVHNSEVLRLMQKCKILLHPSSYEGFGMVCLEALYAGTHVVSFVQPMHHEIKNWHIVMTREDMVAKASELLQAEDLNHERVMVFDIENSARKMMRLFDQ